MFHVVLSGGLVVLVFVHLVVLHLWISSSVFSDRVVSYLECVFFLSVVLLRDLSVVLWFFGLFVGAVLLFWSFVFHEESFGVFSASVTAGKILPE